MRGVLRPSRFLDEEEVEPLAVNLFQLEMAGQRRNPR
jgi:hypothetical protein